MKGQPAIIWLHRINIKLVCVHGTSARSFSWNILYRLHSLDFCRDYPVEMQFKCYGLSRKIFKKMTTGSTESRFSRFVRWMITLGTADNAIRVKCNYLDRANTVDTWANAPQCRGCDGSIHLACINMTTKLYTALTACQTDFIGYVCLNCGVLERAGVQYGLALVPPTPA